MAAGHRVLWTPVDSEIARFAWPVFGSGLTSLAHSWIDTFWVSRLENADAALAALSIGSFCMWIYTSIAALIGVGLNSLVARYVGARRPGAAAYVGFQGFWAAALIGGLTALVSWHAAAAVYTLADAAPEVQLEGLRYVRIYWWGGTCFMTYKVSEAVFRGRGHTLPPLLISIGALICNTILDPLFLFGIGPLPAMGVSGVSFATVISYALAASVGCTLLARRGWVSRRRPADDELRLRPSTPLSAPNRFQIDVAVLVRMARVGLPIAISGVLFSLIYIVISRVAEAAGGTSAQASLGIGHRGEALAYILSVAYSTAAAALVGHRMGAGAPGAAAQVAWRAVLQAMVLCGLWALVLHFADESLVSIFLEPGTTHSYASAYLRIIAWCVALQAAEVVLEGAFGGAGLTIPPMIITVSLTALRIPLAWWVGIEEGYGVNGIWWTLTATAVLRGLVMAAWFARGTWKTSSV